MSRRTKKILRVELREKDEWILDELKKLIEGKKAMGIKTSINFEVARLLKKGLTGGE